MKQGNFALQTAGQLWFAVALAGMGLFVGYIVAFFYGPTLRGDFAAWNANRFLQHGFVAGDTAGNLALASHVLLAAIITASGLVQLVPQLRRRAIVLHRWNGRLFLLAAALMSLGGLYLNFTRGSGMGTSGPGATNVNGVLILAFAALALYFARAGNVDAHRRWALRTFMVVSGVWFLRVGFMSWMIIGGMLYGAPRYLDEFFAAWSWGSYLVPLLVLELYLRAQASGSGPMRLAVSALVITLTIVMGIGIFGAFNFFWRPLLQGG